MLSGGAHSPAVPVSASAGSGGGRAAASSSWATGASAAPAPAPPVHQHHTAAHSEPPSDTDDDAALLEEGGPDEDDLRELRSKGIHIDLAPARAVAAAAIAGTGGGGGSSAAAAGAGGGGAAADDDDADSPCGSAFWPVAFWVGCSICSVLFNKWLFLHLYPFPLWLTFFHLSLAAAGTAALGSCRCLEVPPLPWAAVATAALPVAALYALSLGLTGMAVQRLTASFWLTAKSGFVPLAALVVGVAAGADRLAPGRQALIAALLAGGIAVLCHWELLFDAYGVGYQAASAVAEGARLVAAQRLLQAHLPKGASPLVSVRLLAPLSAGLMLPVAALVEPGGGAALFARPAVLGGVVASTLVAFTLSLAVANLVGRASGAALTVAGVLKDVAAVGASLFLFNNPVTPQQVGGFLAVLYGLNLHDAARAAERDTPLRELLKTAATNKRALAAVVGVAVLGGVATTRLHMDHWAR